MHSGAPYRRPANGPNSYGWLTNRYAGGCFQHWRRSEAQAAVYQNLTRVANWLCGGAAMPPYARQDFMEEGGEGANPNCDNTGGVLPGDSGDCPGAHGHQPCG